MEGEANDEDLSPTYLKLKEEPKVEKLDALERVVGDATAEAVPLTLALLKHITNDFSIENIIGEGGFAIVYLGTLPNGSRIAVKRILNNMDERVFHDEVDITIKAAHKNTVRLIGHCCDTQMVPIQHEGKTIFAEEKEMLICMEYVPNGTLDRYITGLLDSKDLHRNFGGFRNFSYKVV